MKKKFSRFELKYVISDTQKKRLVEVLKLHMSLDPKAPTDGGYRIASLYYDSPDLSCYRAKIEGLRYRRKVRVRVYQQFADDLDTPAFLEVKQRLGKTVQKRRLVATLGQSYQVLDRDQPCPELDTPEDQVTAEEIRVLSNMLQLRPTCVTSYRREAWVGSDAESRLRVTFDHEVACRSPEHRLGQAAHEQRIMPADRCILEVKADQAIPLWVSRTLAEQQLPLRKVSKYCAGVEKLGAREHGATLV